MILALQRQTMQASPKGRTEMRLPLA